jgi:hypothetical protein
MVRSWIQIAFKFAENSARISFANQDEPVATRQRAAERAIAKKIKYPNLPVLEKNYPSQPGYLDLCNLGTALSL